MNSFHQYTSALPRRLPPLSALLAFERAAIQLSFSRAAKDLGVSPSAISHQIRGLEEWLGIRLFARVGRSITITAEGEYYLKAISAALGAVETANRDLMRNNSGPAELKISSLPFFTSTVLLPALNEFEQANPLLTLRIEATHQYADFNSSDVDVAIRYGRQRASGLNMEALVEVQSIPVCSPNLLSEGFVEISELESQVLIHVGSQPQAWRRWCDDVGAAQFEPRGNLWFDNVQSALEAAEHGLGVVLAMHPLIRARQGFGEKIIAPFPDSIGGGGETFYLATRPEQVTNHRISAVRHWIKDAVERASGRSILRKHR